MATYLYDNLQGLFGYASAVSVVIFALSLIVALLYLRLVMRRDLQGPVRWLAPRAQQRHRTAHAPADQPRLALSSWRSPSSASSSCRSRLVVLGGFRTNLQLVNDPAAMPDPWVASNYTSILKTGFVLAPGGTARLSPC